MNDSGTLNIEGYGKLHYSYIGEGVTIYTLTRQKNKFLFARVHNYIYEFYSIPTEVLSLSKQQTLMSVVCKLVGGSLLPKITKDMYKAFKIYHITNIDYITFVCMAYYIETEQIITRDKNRNTIKDAIAKHGAQYLKLKEFDARFQLLGKDGEDVKWSIV